jgi:phosphatidylinositol alpha-mannosyltransferase
MKIALITPYDYPFPGGVNEHITHLSREFQLRGHYTRIIAASTAEQSSLGNDVIKVSSQITSIPISGSVARVALSLRVYADVKKILDAENFDIVHVHEPLAPMLCLAALRHSRAVNVGTFHAYRESNALYKLAQSLAARTLENLHGRIFVSEAVRDHVLDCFPGNFRLIPLTIEAARFAAPGVAPIREFADGRPNLLFVGRMESRKGFRYLLRAYQHIKAVMPDVRLLVVGAFGDRDKVPFIRFTRQNHLHSIHFIGWVSRQELPRYYRTATVFCAPSTGFESFGMVLLEAMAAGVPIVASDIAGYRLVMGDGIEGCLVQPANPRAIADAVIALLQNPAQRDGMANRGLATARKYDSGMIAERILDYYGSTDFDGKTGQKRPKHVDGNYRSCDTRTLGGRAI